MQFVCTHLRRCKAKWNCVYLSLEKEYYLVFETNVALSLQLEHFRSGAFHLWCYTNVLLALPLEPYTVHGLILYCIV